MANGSNIPSGSAPLFLGSFNSNRAAMMQKMTDRMIEQADKERTQQSKERADMLKALSFDAVAGLGRKAQEAHLNELEGLQDKWSRKWIENGKKLTDRDYMELERDKVNMQQKVASMKYNVAQYGYHAKTLMEHPELYHPSTVAGMKQYYEGGDVGKDISEVVRYMPDTSSYLGKAYGSLRTAEGDEKKGAYNPDQNAFETKYSNRRQIEERLKAGLQNNEYYKSLINSGDPYIIKKANEDVDNFINSIVTEKTGFKGATAADLKRMETDKLPSRQKEFAQKTGITAPNAEHMNEISQRIMEGDQDALNILGRNSESVEYLRDGTIVITGKKGRPTKDFPDGVPGQVETIPPPDPNDPFSKQSWKINILTKIYPNLKGDTSLDAENILPDYETKTKGKKAEYAEVNYLKSLFNPTPNADIKINDPENPDKQIDVEAYTYKHRQNLINELKIDFPKDTFNTSKQTNLGKRAYPLEWTEEDGTEHTFNLRKKEDLKKIQDLIQKRLGRESQGTTRTTTTAPTKDTTPQFIDIPEGGF